MALGTSSGRVFCWLIVLKVSVQGLAYWQLRDQADRQERRRRAGLQGGRVSRRWRTCEVSGYSASHHCLTAGCATMLAVLLACTVLATSQELLPEAETVEWINSLLTSFWSLLQPLATRWTLTGLAAILCPVQCGQEAGGAPGEGAAGQVHGAWLQVTPDTRQSEGGCADAGSRMWRWGAALPGWALSLSGHYSTA